MTPLLHDTPSGDTVPRTVLPPRPGQLASLPERRSLGKLSRNDIMPLAGGLFSAWCTTMLLFGRLTPLSGDFGFVVVFFLVFLCTYAVLVATTEDGPAVVVVRVGDVQVELEPPGPQEGRVERLHEVRRPDHEDELRAGMADTLARLKDLAESTEEA